MRFNCVKLGLVLPLIQITLASQNVLEPGNSGKGSFEHEVLEAHNRYRKLHGSPPLTLDPEITRVAQKWANYLAEHDSKPYSTSNLKHSGNPDFGENLFSSGGQLVSGATPVDSWYSEIKLYKNYNNDPTITGYPPWNQVGHFTQLVWKDTKKLGVAKAISRYGVTYVVANYSPTGNYKGQFVKNVPPPQQ